MNSNVAKVIDKCKAASDGELFLSLKPRIDDLSTTVAHLYSAGGRMCNFNMPSGNDFRIWNKEYQKYIYEGEDKFVSGTDFEYLFSNWETMIEACENRATDGRKWEKGKASGTKPKNYYERKYENMIAAYNSILAEDSIAVIDMEYSVGREKLGNAKIDKNPKADLVCAAVENNKIIFYLTEYKATENGFGVSLQKHYDDMSVYYNDIKIKEHLIKTLQERVNYALIECSDELKKVIDNLSADSIEVRLLFLFSHASNFESKKINVLARGYKYIVSNASADNVPVKYGYIKAIEKGCLMKTILRDFENEGKFELV